MPDVGEGFLVRVLNTYRTIVIAIALVVIGLILLYVSGLATLERDQPALQVLLRELGALLFVTGGLAILWDLKGRRDFADEVLAKAQVGTDIRSSGLRRLSMQWLDDVEWTDMFRHSREVEVFVSYGSSWRNVHWSKLDTYSREKNHKLRVYLPHPDDEATISVLAQRYDSTSERIVRQITDAAKAFASLRQPSGGADIRIYYRRGDPTFACYRFDEQIVVTLYSHRRTRSDVPTMLIGPGTLYDFFANELEAIRIQSEEQSAAELSESAE